MNEDLGGGLTRRRPAPGEVDYALLEQVWIYEFALHVSTPVDDGALCFAGTEGYVRATFAAVIERAALQMKSGEMERHEP